MSLLSLQCGSLPNHDLLGVVLRPLNSRRSYRRAQDLLGPDVLVDLLVSDVAAVYGVTSPVETEQHCVFDGCNKFNW